MSAPTAAIRAPSTIPRTVRSRLGPSVPRTHCLLEWKSNGQPPVTCVERPADDAPRHRSSLPTGRDSSQRKSRSSARRTATKGCACATTRTVSPCGVPSWRATRRSGAARRLAARRDCPSTTPRSTARCTTASARGLACPRSDRRTAAGHASAWETVRLPAAAGSRPITSRARSASQTSTTSCIRERSLPVNSSTRRSR